MLGISSEATIKVYTWICLGFRIAPPLEFFFLGATIKVYAGISSAATMKVYTYNLRKKGGVRTVYTYNSRKKGGSGPPGPPPLDPPMNGVKELSLIRDSLEASPVFNRASFPLMKLEFINTVHLFICVCK